MPCFQINLIQVDFKTADKVSLEKAISRLGWLMQGNVVHTSKGKITLLDGKVECESKMTPLVNALKVEYSKQIVAKAATMFGLEQKKVGNEIHLNWGGFTGWGFYLLQHLVTIEKIKIKEGE